MFRSENGTVDRIALVTGAASGIGAATARLLAGQGVTAYCADINEGGCLRVASEIYGDAAPAFVLALDVTSEEQREAGVLQVLSASHKLDILVNCAGISHGSAFLELTLQDWRRVFAVNVEGTFLGTKHAIRAMTPHGGSIVNLTSASGIRASAGASAYSTSKAAVGMLTRVAAKECRDSGLPIRVNAVAPGGVRTPMWRTMPFFRELVRRHGSENAAFRALAGSDLNRRFAEPEEIAAAIVFLASDAAAMITGIELPIDGGYLL